MLFTVLSFSAWSTPEKPCSCTRTFTIVEASLVRLLSPIDQASCARFSFAFHFLAASRCVTVTRPPLHIDSTVSVLP